MDWEFQVKRIMRWGIFFALGWGACTVYYRVPHLWEQKAALVKQAACEHKRADTAIYYADVGDPPPAPVVRDCPHPK